MKTEIRLVFEDEVTAEEWREIFNQFKQLNAGDIGYLGPASDLWSWSEDIKQIKTVYIGKE